MVVHSSQLAQQQAQAHAATQAKEPADIGSQRNRLGINDGPALRALAITADLLGDGNGAEIWMRLEVQYLERRLRAWRRHSKKAAESLVSGPGRNLAEQAVPYPCRGNFTPAQPLFQDLVGTKPLERFGMTCEQLV